MSKVKYTGPELEWSTEDVYRIASQEGITIKSHEDAAAILHESFEENEHIMEVINNVIAAKILAYTS